MEDAMHGLEDGDHVTFKEINGMTQLNGKTCQVKGKAQSTVDANT